MSVDSESFRKKLGALLQAERDRTGLSRYMVANASIKNGDGLTQTQIKNIEEGDKSYTIDSLYKYCIATNIDLKTILNRL